MKKWIFFVFLGFFSVLSLGVFAQGLVLDETPIPIGTAIDAILGIIKNRDGWKGIGMASSILACLIQLGKSDTLGGFLDKSGRFGPYIRRLIILLMSQTMGFIISFSSGKFSWIDAIVTGLITQGGAVAIYEHIKPFFAKKV